MGVIVLLSPTENRFNHKNLIYLERQTRLRIGIWCQDVKLAPWLVTIDIDHDDGRRSAWWSVGSCGILKQRTDVAGEESRCFCSCAITLWLTVPQEGDSIILSIAALALDTENPYPKEIIICEPHHRYYNHRCHQHHRRYMLGEWLRKSIYVGVEAESLLLLLLMISIIKT